MSKEDYELAMFYIDRIIDDLNVIAQKVGHSKFIPQIAEQ